VFENMRGSTAKVLLFLLFEAEDTSVASIMQGIGTTDRQTIYTALKELKNLGYENPTQWYENHTPPCMNFIHPLYENHTPLYENHTPLAPQVYENHTPPTAEVYENHTPPSTRVYENHTPQEGGVYENHTPVEADCMKTIHPNGAKSMKIIPDALQVIPAEQQFEYIEEPISLLTLACDADRMSSEGPTNIQGSPYQLRRREQVGLLLRAWAELKLSPYTLQQEMARTWLRFTNDCAEDVVLLLEELAERKVRTNQEFGVSYVSKVLKNRQEEALAKAPQHVVSSEMDKPFELTEPTEEDKARWIANRAKYAHLALGGI